MTDLYLGLTVLFLGLTVLYLGWTVLYLGLTVGVNDREEVREERRDHVRHLFEASGCQAKRKQL